MHDDFEKEPLMYKFGQPPLIIALLINANFFLGQILEVLNFN